MRKMRMNIFERIETHLLVLELTLTRKSSTPIWRPFCKARLPPRKATQIIRYLATSSDQEREKEKT
jgi:hypothetical protein